MTSYVVGVDIGGTCTDCVVVDERGTVTLGKAFSTPPDFADGILDALDVAARELDSDVRTVLSQTRLFLHSTTVAENAVVDGARARGPDHDPGLRGHALRDARWLRSVVGADRGREAEPVDTDKLPPIVPRSLIVGIGERIDSNGQ